MIRAVPVVRGWRAMRCATCEHRRPSITGDECRAIEALFDEGLVRRQLPIGHALVDGGDDASCAGTVRLIVSPQFGCVLHTPSGVMAAPPREVQDALDTLATALRMQRANTGTTDDEDALFHAALMTVQRASGVMGLDRQTIRARDADGSAS